MDIRGNNIMIDVVSLFVVVAVRLITTALLRTAMAFAGRLHPDRYSNCTTMG